MLDPAHRRGQPPHQRLRVLVLGYLVRGPLGGLAWHHLQYVLGLARLGHEVYFIEDSDDYPSCYDPSRHVTDADPTYGLRFTGQAFERIGLPECWAYYDAHTDRWLGPLAGRVHEVCSSTELLLNVSGVNPLRGWTRPIPRRVLIDTDPVFTQIRHLRDEGSRRSADDHTAFFSFGENVGRDDCGIPDDGFPWQPTRQPVVLDAWPVTPGPSEGTFTTVMQWESYPACEYGGRRFGMKGDSFREFLELPRRTGPIYDLAVGSPSAPRELLQGYGWRVDNPLPVTRDLDTYQAFLRGSKAEFGVAKHGYVTSRCGWFSERSAAYLASGRPALIQDTGLTGWLNADAGLVPFRTLEDAVAGVEAINGNYRRHCAAAREVAEAWFDSDRVLEYLLERVFAEQRPPLAERSGSSCEWE